MSGLRKKRKSKKGEWNYLELGINTKKLYISSKKYIFFKYIWNIFFSKNCVCSIPTIKISLQKAELLWLCHFSLRRELLLYGQKIENKRTEFGYIFGGIWLDVTKSTKIVPRQHPLKDLAWLRKTVLWNFICS